MTHDTVKSTDKGRKKETGTKCRQSEITGNRTKGDINITEPKRCEIFRHLTTESCLSPLKIGTKDFKFFFSGIK